MKSVVNGECVYPEKDDDCRITVTEKDVKKMKDLRKRGLSYEKIGELINRQKNVVKAYLLKDYSKNFTKYVVKSNMKRYSTDKIFREQIKETVRKNQKKRYENDIEYRIYLACKKLGCKFVKERFGSLERYRKYRIKLFKLEKDPKINKQQYLEMRRVLRKRYHG